MLVVVLVAALGLDKTDSKTFPPSSSSSSLLSIQTLGLNSIEVELL